MKILEALRSSTKEVMPLKKIVNIIVNQISGFRSEAKEGLHLLHEVDSDNKNFSSLREYYEKIISGEKKYEKPSKGKESRTYFV